MRDIILTVVLIILASFTGTIFGNAVTIILRNG